MKHTALKSAFLHLSATFLLIMGTVSASAQYYMNVLKNDGTNVQYKVSDINQVWFSGTASPSVSYEFVDLGLSVKWATFNVGASKPEGYGDYYAWGETETKSSYTWTNYRFRTSGDSYDNVKFSKYNTSSSYGTVDNNTTLKMSDDVARQKWGGNWRMPTKDEFTELLNNCTWTWTTLNGVNGYRVTSNKSGYTDRSIFLPFAGYRGTTSLDFAGSGYYWSSSLDTGSPDHAWILYFYSGYHSADYYGRYIGRSVRPVCPSATWPGITSISFDNSSESLFVGNSYKLTATLKSGEDNYSFFSDYYDQIIWSSSNESVATVDTDGTITALSIGTATITAAFNSFKADCVIKVIAVPEYVDLGLSVKWATCNVGASKPEDDGDYYAWGETEPKTDYSWSTYKWCNGSYDTQTKYCNNSRYGKYGFTDSRTTLEMSDDVARQKWGGNWRMPTQTEFNELLNNCTWTWTTQNGVKGYLVTSKKSGYEGRSIFLPAAGWRPGPYYVGYWSSSLETDSPVGAWILYFYSGNHFTSGYDRCCGLSVRPVCP